MIFSHFSPTSTVRRKDLNNDYLASYSIHLPRADMAG